MALTGSTAAVDDHVAELGSGTDPAPVEPAAEDQAAADAGPERDHDHVRGAAAGSGLPFGERRAVGVVVDRSRKPERLGRPSADVNAGQRDVHGEDGCPGALVDRRRNADPHGGDRLVAHRLDGVRQPAEQRLGRVDRRRPALRANDRPVPLDDADVDLRPAHVDADRALCLHAADDSSPQVAACAPSAHG